MEAGAQTAGDDSDWVPGPSENAIAEDDGGGSSSGEEEEEAGCSDRGTGDADGSGDSGDEEEEQEGEEGEQQQQAKEQGAAAGRPSAAGGRQAGRKAAERRAASDDVRTRRGQGSGSSKQVGKRQRRDTPSRRPRKNKRQKVVSDEGDTLIAILRLLLLSHCAVFVWRQVKKFAESSSGALGWWSLAEGLMLAGLLRRGRACSRCG